MCCGKSMKLLSSRPQNHTRCPPLGFMFHMLLRLGEILAQSAHSFSSTQHLSWGDVSVDSIVQPSLLNIHLWFSKCDQFGKGIGVFMGRTTNKLCPIQITSWLHVLAFTFNSQTTTGEKPPIWYGVYHIYYHLAIGVTEQIMASGRN